MKTAGVDLYNASVTKQFGTGGGGGSTTATTTTMQQQQQQKMEEDGDAIMVNCRICYDQFTSASDVFSLGCKHSFCRSCYGDYLDNQIREGQLCIIARCPEFKCLQTVTESVFQKLADPSLKMNYDRYMLRNFIETYKNMKHCPAPGMMNTMMMMMSMMIVMTKIVMILMMMMIMMRRRRRRIMMMKKKIAILEVNTLLNIVY